MPTTEDIRYDLHAFDGDALLRQICYRLDLFFKNREGQLNAKEFATSMVKGLMTLANNLPAEVPTIKESLIDTIDHWAIENGVTL